MQRRKLFIILAVIIIIPLIGLSAQCGANIGDKIDVTEDEANIEETPIDGDEKDSAGSGDESNETNSGVEMNQVKLIVKKDQKRLIVKEMMLI